MAETEVHEMITAVKGDARDRLVDTGAPGAHAEKWKSTPTPPAETIERANEKTAIETPAKIEHGTVIAMVHEEILPTEEWTVEMPAAMTTADHPEEATGSSLTTGTTAEEAVAAEVETESVAIRSGVTAMNSRCKWGDAIAKRA